MNINTSTTKKISKVYGSSFKEIRRDRIARVTKRSERNICRFGKLCQYGLQEYEKIPEIRESKVNEIRNRIKNGTYKINSKEIVEKIFEPVNGKY